MELTTYQQDVLNAKICPYCKSETRITTEFEIYRRVYRSRAIIACANFPNCDSYVGTHEDGEPLGRLGDKKLRYHKGRAHHWFDKIWREKFKDRTELYEELAEFLNIPDKYTHMGMFQKKTCIKVEKWAEQYYKKLKNDIR